MLVPFKSQRQAAVNIEIFPNGIHMETDGRDADVEVIGNLLIAEVAFRHRLGNAVFPVGQGLASCQFRHMCHVEHICKNAHKGFNVWTCAFCWHMNGSMKTSLLAVMLIICATAAKAESFDFTYTNLFNGAVWTWNIDGPPTSFGTDFFVYNINASMDGAAGAPYRIAFTPSAMSFTCDPFSACLWDSAWPATMQGQLYSGPTSNPTFDLGTFMGFTGGWGGQGENLASLVVTDPPSVVDTPEPSTAFLLVVPLLLVLRRYSRREGSSGGLSG